MSGRIHPSSFLLLLLVFVFAPACARAQEDDGRLGISYHEFPLGPEYRFAYLTAGYDYGKPAKDRDIAARLFLVSKSGDVQAARGFLGARLPRSADLEKIHKLDRNPVLSNKNLDGQAVFEISELFPVTVRRYLGRPGEVVSGSVTCTNCLGTAEAFGTDQPVSSLDTPEFRRYLSRLHRVEASEKPHFGEVLFFPTREHAAIYLFDDLIFQKPTWGIYHSYEIVPYDQMFETMNNAIRHYSNGAPSSGATVSPWDVFVSQLMGARSIDPPSPLTDLKFIERYRAMDCEAIALGKDH